MNFNIKNTDTVQKSTLIISASERIAWKGGGGLRQDMRLMIARGKRK